MSDIIVINNGDGTVGICYPCGNSGLTTAQTAVKDVPTGKTHRITDPLNIPASRNFRGAWTDDNVGDTVDIDMPRARIIQTNTIRADRDERWTDFDGRYVVAQRDGISLAALDTERQALRDAPQECQTDIDNATTPEDLAVVWPTILS